MSARASIPVLVLGLALASPAHASDVGYLYGRVETVDGDVYQGQLRWGDEESFWDDIFNATKVENPNLQYVDRPALRRLRREHRGGWDFFFGDDELTHIFASRFGDLQRIQVRRGDDLVVAFRNGEELRLHDGSNDVGADITVIDPKLGQHILRWNRIRAIEFRDTPAKLEGKPGEPIYGTVRAGRFDFTGRIQWDFDECLTSDKLDGDTEDGRASIRFGDIASIRKYRRGSLVKLKSGSELYVHGTNDVNSDNRGVLVKLRDMGTVRIGWGDFDEVTFQAAPNSGPSYADYGAGHQITGSVATHSERYTGRIVFDLDESWDFELLQGMNGRTEYLIPFRDVVRIQPKGTNRSVVELRNGLTVELEDSQDVSRKNEGLLVFTDARKPKYVAWRDVDEIVFR